MHPCVIRRFPCDGGFQKRTVFPLIWSLILVALASASGLGQELKIASFNRNGELVCTNLFPYSVAIVEWASSLDGPWSSDWTGLSAVTANSEGAIRVRVPMYYRVRGVSTNPRPSPWVWIPPGVFMMGSPPSEPARTEIEGPQEKVTISRGFWMGRYEVTQGEYLAVMGDNPSYFKGDLTRPVECVSWYQAMAYCDALTQRDQRAGRLPPGYVYRLPTEAEWEYACRAGTTTAFHYGSELRSGMANFDGRLEYPPCEDALTWCANPSGVHLDRTTAVGSYAPNAWGLYDMHGNVWEWNYDGQRHFSGRPVTDPVGPGGSVERSIRGGSYAQLAFDARSAYRHFDSHHYPDSYRIYVGFRAVLAPQLP
jgi:formylglycine-generating enzyme required for sulfatase activity